MYILVILSGSTRIVVTGNKTQCMRWKATLANHATIDAWRLYHNVANGGWCDGSDEGWRTIQDWRNAQEMYVHGAYE